MKYIQDNNQFQTEYTCESRLLVASDLTSCHTETKFTSEKGKIIKTATGIIAALLEPREIIFKCGGRQEVQQITGITLIQMPSECRAQIGNVTYPGNTKKQTCKIPKANLQVSKTDLLTFTTSTTMKPTTTTDSSTTILSFAMAGWKQDMLLVFLLIAISAITTTLIIHRIYKQKKTTDERRQ